MATRFRRSSQSYELLPRTSSDSENLPDLKRHVSNPSASWLSRLVHTIPAVVIKPLSSTSAIAQSLTPRRRLRSVPRAIYWTVFFLPHFIVFLVLFASIVFPSYTHRPAHYNDLRKRSLNSTDPGRANPNNEKIFIAASIYEKDGELTNGAWGKEVLALVDLLGPENVYLSIYENDPDPLTQRSLTYFKKSVTCNSSITAEDLDMSTLPRVSFPDGSSRIKRIAFLAEVRNRALAPIETARVQFDRILFINDVNFDPIEAAQLLLSTNIDSTGHANYGAACAVDFINPFKFYDRFATRDLDGFDMGIPFFPWFTSAGTATSRNEVLSGSDAVRVRSCWGGMVAYEAKWFQDQRPFHRSVPSSALESTPNSNLDLAPLRFRYSDDLFWEASECCLVNGDLTYRRSGMGMPAESGIYMNPFVRVAYDTTTLSWLSLTRRPERLYSIIHNLLNPAVGFPHDDNYRRKEEPGTIIHEREWKYDDPVAAFQEGSTDEQRSGHFVNSSRIAEPGGFCGGRFLLVMNEVAEQGKGKWSKVDLPSPPAT